MGTLTGLSTVITYLTIVLTVGTVILAASVLLSLAPTVARHHRARLARNESVPAYWRRVASSHTRAAH